ncbi:hypothetical protein CISIN_1g022963mg [Citrus sinensis]|uniref:Translin family protein n=1 Tax=Citrus sinensis TaxID=2711 RepID=A0A067FVW3_CITSI|nr:hypothetical protein CISIN_1g022963mg [Citrus sinensis]
MFHAPALRSWISSSRSPIIMASKSKTHRLHQLSGTALQSIAKRPRTITTESYMKDAFANYAGYLNELNEKRERVVKSSRDITINSKKVIFQVQEYVEAATFCKFCRTGTLLDLEELNAGLLPLSDPAIEPLQINVFDYLLGLADLTGELMRLAIGRISDGELEFAEKICRFSRDIYRELTLVVPLMDNNSDMKTKMDTMLQSVLKIENACLSVHVRGSEYTLLGSSDPSFLMGVPDMQS